MIGILFVVTLLAATLWAKHASTMRKLRKAERARVRAANPRRYARRAARWVLHRIFRRLFVWQEPRGRVTMQTPAVVARRGLWRKVKIRIDRHMVVAGLTGSGKSSTTRVLAMHALKAGASLVLIDLKPGAPEGELYAGKARVVTSSADTVSLIRSLMADPGRDGSDLVIIVDETSALIRQLTKAQFGSLCTLIDISRHFKIRWFFGIQHPSRVNLPSEIQCNITTTLAHRVHSSIESGVVFPGMADWQPHELTAPGSLLIHTEDRRSKPHPLAALWLSEVRFASLGNPVGIPGALRAPVSAPVPDVTDADAPAVTLAKIPSPEAPEARPITLSDNQQLVCLALEIAARPMETKEIVDATDLPQNRTADALKALVTKGLVTRDPDIYPALFTLNIPEDPS